MTDAQRSADQKLLDDAKLVGALTQLFDQCGRRLFSIRQCAEEASKERMKNFRKEIDALKQSLAEAELFYEEWRKLDKGTRK